MKTSNTIIHSAILLCSTMVPRDEELDAYTVGYLQEKGFSVDQQVVTESIEKHNKNAKLYATFRGNISRVQNIGYIKELYRYIWVYKVVSCLYDTLSPAQLLSIVNNKYELEKSFDEDIDRNKFGAFWLIDKEFYTKESIRKSGKFLVELTEDLDNAVNQLAKAFSKLSGFEYMSDMYTLAAVEELKPTGANKQPSAQGASRPVAENAKREVVAEVPQSNPIMENSYQSSKTELQLQDEIRILKKDKHDLEVKLMYAKKDAIREFICTLTDYGWNCPLSELYRLLSDDETPEKIKGIINNLFTALGSENVKLSRYKIGEEITLTEENQKTYEPYKYEQLYMGDTAEIYYPGYRYGHEIMVRPIVRKIKDAEDKSNENG